MSNYQLSIDNYELPEGYKQTEVGVIPEDWEIVAIGDISSVSSGGTPSRTNLSYWNGTIPWITTTQIDFNTIDSAEQFITREGLNNSAAKLFPPGTLLLAMYGQGKTRGKVAILGVEASTNQACAAISLSANIYQNYVFHYLVSQYETIRNLSNTGNQENLNGLIIKSIKIPLPALEEQRSIAQALSDVDRLITALEKAIAKKQAIKTATMQQLLTGKKRLPRFGEGKGYQQTAIGLLPEDWDVKSLLELSEKITVGIASAATHAYRTRGIPLIRNQNIKPNKLDDGDILYISEDYEFRFKNKRLQKGDLLTARTGYPGTTCIVPEKFELAQSFTTLITSPNHAKVDCQYLSFFINSDSGQSFFEQNQIGGGQKNVNAGTLRNLLIPLPSSEEQRAIATVLSDMDAEIAALETRLAKTQSIKQGMMQQLLTGKVRLKIETDMEAEKENG